MVEMTQKVTLEAITKIKIGKAQGMDNQGSERSATEK